MGRTAKDRRRYAPKPVEKAALSEKHTGLRLAAVILLLAGGAAALSYALTALLTPQSGWQQVEVKASAGLNCGDEFVFLYKMSGPSSERKALQLAYSDACETAYQLLTAASFLKAVPILPALTPIRTRCSLSPPRSTKPFRS